MKFAEWRHAVVSVVVATSMLAACSGSDSSQESVPASSEAAESTTATTEATTTTSTTTTTTTAVVESTTTEELPTIEVEPDEEGTVPDTVEPPEDPEIPTDTMFDPSTPEGEVEQVVLAENDAYARCLAELPNCDVAAVVRFGALDFADATQEYLERWNSEQLSAENVDSLSARVEAVTFGASGVEAEVTVCVNDAARVYQPSTGLNAPDATGEFTSLRKLLVLAFIDESWRIIGSNPQEQAVGEDNNLCRV